MNDRPHREMPESMRLAGQPKFGEAKAPSPNPASPASLPAAVVPQKTKRVTQRGQFISGAFSNESGTRAYKVYVPTGYTGQSVPLVVMLHGCSQSADDFAAGTRMNVVAEEATCLVVYPEQSSSANASRCWNWFNPSDQQRGRGEPSLVAGITRHLMRQYAIDTQRVYAAGLSAGGAAAAVLGTAYPELYAAIGVHSGLASGAATDLSSAIAAMRHGDARPVLEPPTTPETQPQRIVPTIVFHGDRDYTVHPGNGERVIAQTMAGNLKATLTGGRVPDGLGYTRSTYADEAGTCVFEHWVVHGSGHAWSGGSSTGSYTDPRGPDASREMVRFFLDHVHPEAQG